MFDVHVSCAASWTTGVCHGDGGGVVFVESGGRGLVNAEIIQEGSEIECQFSSFGGGNKLSLCRALGYC